MACVMKYRSRSDILTVILESARTGATKTIIMYKAYLSYSQLMEYLAFLQEKALLECEIGTQLYRPTEKGLKFMTMPHDLNEILSISNSKYSWNS